MKNIVLLGFMGTGKSVVGRRLAADIHYRFVDTDFLIESRAHQRIAWIIRDKGEAHFRQIESLVVREVACRSRCVISTGGGTVLDPKNIEALQRNGILVALQARPEVILKRVRRHEGTRPLLDGPDPLSRIYALLKEREPQYRRASLILDTSDMPVKEVIRKIKEKVWAVEN